MKKYATTRRQVLRNAAALTTIAALGIKPEQVLGAESGVLKVRQVNDIQVLDPGYIIGNAEVSILYACMPRLAVPTKDASGTWTWQPSEYVAALAQKDDTHISFQLKPGLMWSNGAGELTAEDVKFSFERMLKSDWSSRWPTLDHVDVTDHYSGTIVLKSPFVATWLLGLASESGTVLPKAAVEKLKEGKFTTQLPAQLGPYRMTEWTPKQKVVLKADSSWPGTKPAFEEVQFLDIEETKVAELAVEAGDVDIASISPVAAARYRKAPPADVNLVDLPGHQFTWLGMNTENPKLRDVRVRKAIQRAIDVDAILDGAYSGVSPMAHGVIHLGVLGYRSHSNYSYKPDEAKALLGEAGVSGLTFDIKTLSGQAEQLAAAQIIQSNLNDVGISATVTPVDSGRFWNLGLQSKGDDWKHLDLWIMRFGSAPDPADAIQWFTKAQIGIWNWERWTVPEFETLWQAGLVETDKSKRAEIYVRMQDIMEDTGAYVWLTFDPKFYGCRKPIVAGFEPGNDVRVELCHV